jgi:branched-chain amino acid transport system permease protein
VRVLSFDLIVNALVSGLLLGGFYAGVAAGATIAFGLLDIANIAHPAFVVFGAYCAFVVGERLGLDPLLAALIVVPVFYAAGLALYQIYHWAFERRGDDSMRGVAFFFGLMFVGEVVLILSFGVDYRYTSADYVSTTLKLGPIAFPLRQLVPFLGALVILAAAQLFLKRTFIGRAILGVAQDPMALRLMGADPVRLKRIAFGVSIALAGAAGALLLILQPIDPSAGRGFIGRVFAIAVLGGMGSLPGAWVAAVMLGVIENLTSIFIGASWAPAVAFGFLLLTLAVRPSGLFGR